MSDDGRLLASPLVVLDRRRGLAPVLDALIDLARREGVAQMVVGLPLNADGSEGPQARRARDFARVAARVVGLPVALWDERLSTREAEAIVRAQGRRTRRLRQRGQIDAIAAAVILQDYLDHAEPSAQVLVPGEQVHASAPQAGSHPSTREPAPAAEAAAAPLSEGKLAPLPEVPVAEAPATTLSEKELPPLPETGRGGLGG